MEKISKKFHLIKKIKLLQLAFLTVSCLLFIYECIAKTDLLRKMMADASAHLLFVALWIILLIMLVSNIMDFFFYRYYVLIEHRLKRFLYLDSLTGIPDRKSLDAMTENLRDPEKLAKLGCFLFTISNLQELNAKYGHEGGDRALFGFSRLLEKAGDALGLVARNGSNEFACIIENCDEQIADKLLAQLRKYTAEARTAHDAVPIEVDYAYILNREAKIENYSSLIAKAHSNLFSKEGTAGRGQL